MAKPTKNKRTVLIWFEDADGKMPTIIHDRYECDAGLSMIKAFDFAVAKLREEKFFEKRTEHLHD